MKCGRLQGEVIETDGSRVRCWLRISDTWQVRWSTDRQDFGDLPVYPGADFQLNIDTGAITACDFDNAELIAECDRLEREWDDDLKHRTPRMA